MIVTVCYRRGLLWSWNGQNWKETGELHTGRKSPVRSTGICLLSQSRNRPNSPAWSWQAPEVSDTDKVAENGLPVQSCPWF